MPDWTMPDRGDAWPDEAGSDGAGPDKAGPDGAGRFVRQTARSAAGSKKARGFDTVQGTSTAPDAVRKVLLV
jgi:hypothetical protein